MFVACGPPLLGDEEEWGEEKNERLVQKKMGRHRGDIEIAA